MEAVKSSVHYMELQQQNHPHCILKSRRPFTVFSNFQVYLPALIWGSQISLPVDAAGWWHSFLPAVYQVMQQLFCCVSALWDICIKNNSQTINEKRKTFYYWWRKFLSPCLKVPGNKPQRIDHIPSWAKIIVYRKVPACKKNYVYMA